MNAPMEASAPGSVDSTKALKMPDGTPNGRSNSMMSTGLSLPIDSLTQNGTKTFETGAHINCPELPASLSASHARTSASWETLSRINRDQVLQAIGVDSSLRSWKLSDSFNPLGWSLRTCRRCSIPTIAKTFRASSQNLPNAIMWDSQECLTLNISESPKAVAEFSWSQVLDDTPPSSSWLTPDQWNQYLSRLVRNGSQNRRVLGLAILLQLQTSTKAKTLASTWAVNFSLLRKEDGIRWLSGPERLAYMGFAKDWMRGTLKRLMPQATQYPPRLENGLLKF